jgi:hypothetical protein
VRLKRYLNEAVINVNKGKLKAIRGYFIDARESYIENDKNMDELLKILPKVLGKLNKLFDRKIEFIIRDMNYKVMARAKPKDDLKTFEIVLNWNPYWLAGIWGNEKKFNKWFAEGMRTLEHELIHIEQFQRIAKEKDPENAMNILKGIKSKSLDYDRIDGYLSDQLEIMTHAKTAELSLSNLKPEKINDLLKTDKGQKTLTKKSKSFKLYYEHIKGKYDKTWRRFLKYLYMYVDKRMGEANEHKTA